MNYRPGLRVAFCGAGGTGKTTTAKFIAEQLGLPTFKSASRAVYEARDLTEDLVLKMTDQEKMLLQFDIFAAKESIDKNPSYVTDRTILDHYAYCLAYCGAFMDDNRFAEFEDLTRTLMRGTYTHIFYFPWGYWTANSDGVRQDRHSWQSMIDAIITGYIIRWNLPVIEVLQTDGQDARNKFVLDKLCNSAEA